MSRRAHHGDGASTDLAWRGYHPRAAIPSVLVAGSASVGLMVGRWQLPDMSDFAERVGAWVYFVLMAAIWLVPAVGVVYRLVTFTYRVTERSLLVDFGFRYPPEPPIYWKDVTAIDHGAGWLDRCLGVGWVTVAAGDREVTMTGVRDPKAFVETIRAARG